MPAFPEQGKRKGRERTRAADFTNVNQISYFAYSHRNVQ